LRTILERSSQLSNTADLDGDTIRAELPGRLGAALGAVAATLGRLETVARTIARGDLRSEVLEALPPGSVGIAFGEMVRSLRQVSEQASAIARGDLAATTLSQGFVGEVGMSLGRMVSVIQSLLSDIGHLTTKLNTCSTQIAMMAREQAGSAELSVTGVTKASATFEELAASAGQIAERAIDGIRSYNEESTRRVTELRRASEKIGEVVGIINHIAGQTKLLALNAAIEAARAGESGRGFAVVAVEVRKLAEDVVSSTGEIQKLVEEIQEVTGAVVTGTFDGQKRVQTGVELANRSGASLAEILSLAEQTTRFSQQISIATRQQKDGSERCVDSMREIADGCNRTATSARDTAGVVDELNSLAEELRSLVGRFNLTRSKTRARGLASLRESLGDQLGSDSPPGTDGENRLDMIT
ncbi:MAG: methyl-accepting chemotaxis protein, partial [Candidatus Riflebacteria bacterium]|nr:methyl-accepting chemotaxis protein [Candidatus Riflebacteria bacterium]